MTITTMAIEFNRLPQDEEKTDVFKPRAVAPVEFTTPPLDSRKSSVRKLSPEEFDARNRTVLENSLLPGRVAYSLTGRRDPDLKQVGFLGLIKAADRFDKTRGVPFENYAERRIRWEILDYFRENKPGGVKVSRVDQERVQKLDEEVHRLGRELTVSEAAALLKISKKRVKKVPQAHDARKLVYLDGFIEDDGDSCNGSFELVDSKQDPGAEVVDRIALSEALRTLAEEERDILMAFFYEHKKTSEIALEIGKSEARVSQLKKQALSKMRKNLERTTTPLFPKSTASEALNGIKSGARQAENVKKKKALKRGKRFEEELREKLSTDRRAVVQAIQQLSPRENRVLVMWLEGKSYADIGKALSMHPGSTSIIVKRAIDYLKNANNVNAIGELGNKTRKKRISRSRLSAEDRKAKAREYQKKLYKEKEIAKIVEGEGEPATEGIIFLDRYVAQEASIADPKVDVETTVVDRLALRNAIKILPDDQRRAIFLKFYEGFTQAEIGREMGVAEGSVSNILKRAISNIGVIWDLEQQEPMQGIKKSKKEFSPEVRAKEAGSKIKEITPPQATDRGSQVKEKRTRFLEEINSWGQVNSDEERAELLRGLLEMPDLPLPSDKIRVVRKYLKEDRPRLAENMLKDFLNAPIRSKKNLT